MIAIKNQQQKYSRWTFAEINSLTVYIYKRNTLTRGTYVKLPIGKRSVLNIQKKR